MTRPTTRTGLLGVALLLAACGSPAATSTPPPATPPAASPSPATTIAATAPPSLAPSALPSVAPSAAGEVPELLANVEGFDVQPSEAGMAAGFGSALETSIAGAGAPGDVISAQAIGPGGERVDMFAFTVIPDDGKTEDDAIDALLTAIAGAAGAEWQLDEELSAFVIDHDNGRHSILAAWGTVPSGTVYLYLTGEEPPAVDDVAAALLEG